MLRKLSLLIRLAKFKICARRLNICFQNDELTTLLRMKHETHLCHKPHALKLLLLIRRLQLNIKLNIMFNILSVLVRNISPASTAVIMR